jgi:hypothetical protein
MAGIELRSPAFSDHDLIPGRHRTTGTTSHPPCNGRAYRTTRPNWCCCARTRTRRPARSCTGWSPGSTRRRPASPKGRSHRAARNGSTGSVRRAGAGHSRRSGTTRTATPSGYTRCHSRYGCRPNPTPTPCTTPSTTPHWPAAPRSACTSVRRQRTARRPPAATTRPPSRPTCRASAPTAQHQPTGTDPGQVTSAAAGAARSGLRRGSTGGAGCVLKTPSTGSGSGRSSGACLWGVLGRDASRQHASAPEPVRTPPAIGYRTPTPAPRPAQRFRHPNQAEDPLDQRRRPAHR